MPPKRKASGSVPSPRFDHSRFLSFPKEDFFNSFLQPLEFVRERRITFEEGNYDDYGFQKAFEWRRWNTLCMPSDEACGTAVKEFFANTRWDDVKHPPADLSYISYYRRVEVDYSPTIIRELLGLPSKQEELNASKEITGRYNPPDFHQLMDDLPGRNKEEMKALLVQPGRDWKDAARGDSLCVARPHLRPLPRVWAHFIQDTVIPNSNKSDVRKPVLVALYCLLKNYPIDVPRIISERIQHYYNKQFKTDKPRVIYPTLITALIQRAVEQNRPTAPFQIQTRLKAVSSYTKDDMKRIFQQWQKMELESANLLAGGLHTLRHRQIYQPSRQFLMRSQRFMLVHLHSPRVRTLFHLGPELWSSALSNP